MRLSTGLVTGFLLSQLLLSVPGSIFAQTNQSGSNQKKTVKISGKVSDENGKPIPGVSVQLKNGTVIAISSDAGIFSGTADADAILEFSSTGFGKKQIPVNNQESFSVVLFSDAKALDDIVVVGYGTQRKSDLTGAVTQLKVKDLNSVVTANIADAIQGRAAGVSISTNNAPGSQPTIRIRGLGSINASNNPLLVVDGIPLENATLSDFNSNDFASIEILKDASSTAIYGSRGANGVILLTTKTGAAGRNNVSVSTYYGSQSPGRLTEMPGREDFINFINDAYTNTTGKPVYSSANPAPAYNTNWQEALYRDHAPVQSYNVNFNGGTDKTKYLLSAGYFSQDGLLKESGFERFAVRTNLEQNVAKFLTVGTHLQVNRSIKNYNDPNIIDVFRYGWPTMPVKNEDGSFYYAIDDPFHRPYVEGRWNPVSNLGEIVDETGTNRIIGDVYALFKLGKNLTFKTNFAADLSDAKQYYYASSKSTNGWNSKGVGKQFYAQEQQILTDNILTYDNTWGKHKLVATAVYSFQKHVFESLSVNGTGFPSDVAGYNDVSLATNISKPTSDKYGNKLISGTARASYVYDNRYLLTLTGRYDGSTRFGVNNKWGFFPSVGAGWNVTNESFMEPLSEVISRLKIRGSYGYTGNQEIGNYRSLSLLSPTNYVYGSNNLLLGLNEGIGNPDLKWESTRQADIGMDLSILKNRVDITFDYYNRKSNDLIYYVPIPTTSGFKNAFKNIGDVENKGIELTLNVNVINKKDFRWTIGGNLTHNKNSILSLYDDVTNVLLSDDQGIARKLVVGQPINAVYARQSAGIIHTQAELDMARKLQPANNFLELGAEWYVDQNGDGTVTSSDYVNIGTTEPNFYYGVNTNLYFKRITLDIFGQGANDIAVTSTGYNIIGDYQIQGRNYLPSKYVYDRMWSETNPNGSFAKAGSKQNQFSDRSNGGRHYFLIRNIRLGYDINPKLLNRFFVKNLNIYVNAQNFITATNFRGYNPENGDIVNPLAKTITFGLNVNF